MIYAMIAIVVILLVVWIWVNAAFIRKQSSGSARQEQAVRESLTEEPVPTAESAARPQPLVENRADVQQPDGHGDPELRLPSPSPVQGQRSVFAHRDRPYVLHDVNVPEFAEPAWDSVFTRLCEDDHVLGWVAFQDDRQGAADRTYEHALVDALRQHHHATEQLLRHVGLSQVRETSVIGDEGKVWFLTAVDDAWLALFVENDEDALPRVTELLAPVQSAADTVLSEE